MAEKQPKIPRISLRNFHQRRAEITSQLVEAAGTYGFFILHDQEFPTAEAIQQQFDLSSQFFSLPATEKSKTPLIKSDNVGYEYYAQVRPSTGTPDQKESLQMRKNRSAYWPVVPAAQDEVKGEGWKDGTRNFMEDCQNLSMQVLSCFEETLRFGPGYFKERHNVDSPTAQTTLRLIHYPPCPNADPTLFRAGEHTDFCILTLLFQKSGEHGLEVCSQIRETHTSSLSGEKEWIPVPAVLGEIVVNIGDMMMSLSDDRFKSNFHRVRLPTSADARSRSRYSMAYFNQANKDVEIQGPGKKYPKMTALEYIQQAIARNYKGVRNVDANNSCGGGAGGGGGEAGGIRMGKAASAT